MFHDIIALYNFMHTYLLYKNILCLSVVDDKLVQIRFNQKHTKIHDPISIPEIIRFIYIVIFDVLRQDKM